MVAEERIREREKARREEEEEMGENFWPDWVKKKKRGEGLNHGWSRGYCYCSSFVKWVALEKEVRVWRGKRGKRKTKEKRREK